MKKTAALLMALGLALPAMTFAQDGGQPPRRERPAQRDGGTGEVDRPPGKRDGGPKGERRPPIPPLMVALDTNHDGVIDEDEIKNAPEALRKLDKNGDGKLTMDELRPPRPDGDRADGGPRPNGGPDGERVRPNDGNGPAGDGQRPQRRGPRPP